MFEIYTAWTYSISFCVPSGFDSVALAHAHFVAGLWGLNDTFALGKAHGLGQVQTDDQDPHTDIYKKKRTRRSFPTIGLQGGQPRSYR